MTGISLKAHLQQENVGRLAPTAPPQLTPTLPQPNPATASQPPNSLPKQSPTTPNQNSPKPSPLQPFTHSLLPLNKHFL